MSKIKFFLGTDEYAKLLEYANQIEFVGEKAQDLSREDLLVFLAFNIKDQHELIEQLIRENTLRADLLKTRLQSDPLDQPDSQ